MLPKIEMPHIINYLLKNPGLYTLEDMNNYRGLEAHIFVTSGKVGKIFTCLIEEQPSHVYVRAAVDHSQSPNKEPLDAWVKTHKDGSIESAHCTCMAG